MLKAFKGVEEYKTATDQHLSNLDDEDVRLSGRIQTNLDEINNRYTKAQVDAKDRGLQQNIDATNHHLTQVETTANNADTLSKQNKQNKQDKTDANLTDDSHNIVTAINHNTHKNNVNASSIETNKDDIATNVSNIATNKGDIATNKRNIATNTSDIADNKTVANRADTLSKTNKSNIASNLGKINKNITDITHGVSELGLVSNRITQLEKSLEDTENIWEPDSSMPGGMPLQASMPVKDIPGSLGKFDFRAGKRFQVKLKKGTDIIPGTLVVDGGGLEFTKDAHTVELSLSHEGIMTATSSTGDQLSSWFVIKAIQQTASVANVYDKNYIDATFTNKAAQNTLNSGFRTDIDANKVIADRADALSKTNKTNIATNVSNIAKKQNSAIPHSLTTAKTVEGAINELHNVVFSGSDIIGDFRPYTKQNEVFNALPDTPDQKFYFVKNTLVKYYKKANNKKYLTGVSYDAIGEYVIGDVDAIIGNLIYIPLNLKLAAHDSEATTLGQVKGLISTSETGLNTKITTLTNSLNTKQNKSDNSLTTTAKTIVGGINENKANLDLTVQDVNNLNELKTLDGRKLQDLSVNIAGDAIVVREALTQKSWKLLGNNQDENPGSGFIGRGYKGFQFYGYQAKNKIYIGRECSDEQLYGFRATGPIQIGSTANDNHKAENKLIQGTKSATFEEIINAAKNSARTYEQKIKIVNFRDEKNRWTDSTGTTAIKEFNSIRSVALDLNSGSYALSQYSENELRFEKDGKMRVQIFSNGTIRFRKFDSSEMIPWFHIIYDANAGNR